MKLKYFLRGLGIGIVFTAVMGIAFARAEQKPVTEEEIIQKAAKLGMLTQEQVSDLLMENSLKQLENNSTPEPSEEPTSKPTMMPTLTPLKTMEPDGRMTDPTAEPAVSPSPIITATPVPTLSPTHTPLPTATPLQTPAVSSVPSQTPAAEPDSQSVTITIKKGMWSEETSNHLKERGIIKDASDFDKYLVKNGWASEIQVGTYKIPKGASYGQIAEIITSKD